MNQREEELRSRVAENLLSVAEKDWRVGRIRNLLETKLRENPLTTWSPIWGDPWRSEVFGYEEGKFEGGFRIGDLLGRYDLTVYSDGADLPNSRLRLLGGIDGYGSLGYELPPMADIKKYNRSELNAFLERVESLEFLLKLIGLISD